MKTTRALRKSLRVAARRVQLTWLNQHSSRPLRKYRVRMLVGEVSFLVDQVDLAEPDQDGAASHPALAGVPFRSQQLFSPNETASPSSRNSIMLPCTQGRQQGQERVCGGHGPASATAPTSAATAGSCGQWRPPRCSIQRRCTGPLADAAPGRGELWAHPEQSVGEALLRDLPRAARGGPAPVF